MQSPNCQGFCQIIRQRLWDCRERREFCDVILETDKGDQVWAHRAIVSAGSFGLHSMLIDESLPGKDEASGMTVLRLPEVSPDSLNDIVRFLYLGSVEKFNLESVDLWKRFQICEPFRLCGENATTNQTPTSQEVPAPEPAVEIKREVEEEFQAGDISSDNESLYQPEESNTQKDSQPKSAGSPVDKKEQSSRGKRKRKCSTPRRRKIKYSSPEDSETEIDEDFAIKAAITRKTPKRLSKKNPPSPKIKTEKVPEEDKFSEEEAIFSEDDNDSYGAEEDDWREPPKKKTPVKRKPRKAPVKPKVPAKPKVAKVAKVPRLKKVKLVKPRIPRIPNAKPRPLPTGPLCRTCNIPFDTKEQYREHRENYHTTGHKCVECGQSFHRVNRLKAHRVERHPADGLPPPKWHRCKVEGCGYKSVYADGIDSHNKLVHVKERSICELCGESFCNSYYVTLHKRRVHGDSGPTYTCDECGTCFYIPKDLKIHQERVHKGTKRFLCDQCPYMSFDKDAVQLHMFSKHGVPLKEHRVVFDCPHCDYKSTAKSVITAHIERHSGKEYKCDQCNSTFPCNRDLRGHIRRKHSEKPLSVRKCPYEGCTYASKYGGPSVLANHITRMHVNKDFKPWACEVCNYRTNVKGNLHLHLRKVHKLVPNIQQHRVPKFPADQPPGPVSGSSPPEQYQNQAPPPQPVPESPQHSSQHSMPEMYPNIAREEVRVIEPRHEQRMEPVTSQPQATYQTLSAAQAVHGHPAHGHHPHHHHHPPGPPHSAPPGPSHSAPPTHSAPPHSGSPHGAPPHGAPPHGAPPHGASPHGPPPGHHHPQVSGPPPSHIPLFPSGQYAMMFPPTGHNENLFMQGLL